MDTEQVHDHIRAALPMRLHGPQPGTFISLTGLLHYTPDNPYAVRVAFHQSPEHEPVVWHMGRDLIRDGLIRRTGEGDVQIGPAGVGSGGVVILLRGRDGAALLTVPRLLLGNFLQRTAEAVPYGRETAVPGFLVGLDVELARILTDPN